MNYQDASALATLICFALMGIGYIFHVLTLNPYSIIVGFSALLGLPINAVTTFLYSEYVANKFAKEFRSKVNQK